MGGLFYRGTESKAKMALTRRNMERLACSLDLNYNDMIRVLDRMAKLDNAMQKELIMFLVENITN